MEHANRRFRILTVCTGNICRSPITERVLQAGLDEVSPGSYEVTSAGTQALEGREMTPQAQGIVRVLGGNPDGFIARQVTPQILVEQDLVLALTREHRSVVVGMAPRLLRRTFTLRELARLLPHLTSSGHSPKEKWETILLPASRIKSQFPAEPEEDNVIDPYMHDDTIYRQTTQQIAPAVRTIVSWCM